MTDDSQTRSEDGDVRNALRGALQLRDRSTPVPALARVWPADGSTRPGYSRLRTFVATAVAAGVVGCALLLWWGSHPQGTLKALDPALAHELSMPDYWRVPTDGLLALSAPPLNASLSLEPGFEVSLEESVL